MELKRRLRRIFLFQSLRNMFFLDAIWVIFLLEKGITLTFVAIMDIIFWLTMFLFEIPTGVIADRFGRKVSVITGLLIVSCGIFIFGISNDILMILFSYFIWALGLTFISGAAEAFFYDTVKILGHEGDWAAIFGRISLIGSLSIATATVIGGFLGGISLQLPIFVTSIFGLLTIIPLLTLPEPRISETGLEQEKNYADSPLRTSIQIILSSRVVILLILFQILFTAFLSAFYIFQQPYLQNQGLSIELIGLMIGINTVIRAIGASFVAFYNRLIGRYSLFVLGYIITIIIFLLGVGQGGILIFVIFSIRSFFQGMYYRFLHKSQIWTLSL
ncbi:MAG: MFS transporter [Promethearchaeota archaeon]